MVLNNDRRRRHFGNLMDTYLANQPESERIHLEGPGTNSLAAWFLGPKAENAPVFKDMINQAIDANSLDRKNLFPQDPVYVTKARQDPSYYESINTMMSQYTDLLEKLQGSVPFYSYRYQAHMNWDLTMPSMAGYFAAMLYNQNNVALEASPVTSLLEKQVGDDLCKMLGFDISDPMAPRPWGHITCDGSIANLEAMWAARNAKFYALSIRAALELEEILEPAQDIEVRRFERPPTKLMRMSPWELVNLPLDIVLEIPTRIQTEYGFKPEIVTKALEPYLLQTLGIREFFSRFAPELGSPVVLGPATKHYSWPKNSALTGIGKNAYLDVVVDLDARLDCTDLAAQLEECRRKQRPVMMVVVVLGSTEESAVDPLAKVIELRNKFRKQGLDFSIHVDAAWGGYFASILRDPAPGSEPLETAQDAPDLQYTPALSMSEYVTAQYQAIPGADSVTIDPHKAGYVPYAAGGLCYRNGSMRNLVAFLAPEVYHGSALDTNMGIYGVEGSKSGAAAAGVYLSHRVIRPDRSGYGKILGQALFNSKRLYCGIVTSASKDDRFVVVPVQRLPAERSGGTRAQIDAQLEEIKTRIVDRQNNEIIADNGAMLLLNSLGSDQIIITYGLNFRNTDGFLNRDPVLANDFMQKVFEKLSLQADASKTPDLIITTSDFNPEQYGKRFVQDYMGRLGLDRSNPITMHFLSSTTMCPWLTATADGNFVPELTRAFKKAVNLVITENKLS